MHRNYLLLLYWALALAALMGSGCSNTKYLSENEALLVNNKITFDTPKRIKDKNAFENDLLNIARQQPNARTLGLFRLKLWFFNRASQRRLNKFRNWLKEKVGEPPVVYDSLHAVRSAELMRNYLVNKGFFYAGVDFSTKIRRKRARVSYRVTMQERYVFNEVYLPDHEGPIGSLIREYADEQVIERGEPFDVELLKKERERIADNLRNHGYYYFNKEFVYYELDSFGHPQAIDVYIKIEDATDTSRHQRYSINNIYIYPDYRIDKDYEALGADTIVMGEYRIITTENRYQPEVLINAVHFKNGDYFSKAKNQRTVSHLYDLGIFKFINIKFREFRIDGRYLLDCIIQLTPAKKQEMSVEVEADNSSDYLLGTAVSYTYRNKNIFRGAELFGLNVTGGLESNLRNDEPFFNTVDLSGEFTLLLPKFIVPFNLKAVSKNARPKTRFSLKYNYLRRFNYYNIQSANFTFGYEWRETQNKRHLLNPVDINLVGFDESEASEQFLEILNKSPVLKNSFVDQLIPGLSYAYLLSSKTLERERGFFFLQTNVDLAGNLVHGATTLLNRFREGKQRPFTIFNIPYSQFGRAEASYRHYFPTHHPGRVVGRLMLGAGLPYGNSEALPYIKQFFLGGANSMRAWRIRTLGPGSYNFREADDYAGEEVVYFDQTGDVKLEANLEYRFPVFQFIRGALFVDAGNIWLLQQDSTRMGAEFNLQYVPSEIALGAGMGVRLDFSYFVIRFDAGLKLRDPAFYDRNRQHPRDSWVIRDFVFFGRKNNRREMISMSLAIGYPF